MEHATTASPPGPGWGCLRLLLTTLCLLASAAWALETWLDRWAWPVDPAWYRVEEANGTVTVGCQAFAPVRFDVTPAPGVTRVLVAGGSTTFGFPERPPGTAPLGPPRHGVAGAAQAALDAAWPGQFEVVNLGINGGASEDTLRVLRRTIHLGASALVLYDGHNEFMGFPGGAWAAGWRLATYRRLAVLLPRAVESPGWVGAAAYGDERGAAAVMQQFAHNLRAIAALARGARVPVVMATQASNLRDFQPSWSTEGVVDGAAALTPAERVARLAAHPASADLAFLVGQDRLAAGQDAWSALATARDHDAMPFRASTAVNRVIRAVATESGWTLVDAEAALADLGPPGEASFYDWVHPRPAASARLANALLDGLARVGVLPDLPPTAVAREPEAGEVTGVHTRLAVAWLQWAMVRQHDPWARLARARAHAELAVTASPGDADAAVLLEWVDALERGESPALPGDPTLRARLLGIHPGLARRARDPSPRP